jgi:hypothetical protein
MAESAHQELSEYVKKSIGWQKPPLLDENHPL